MSIKSVLAPVTGEAGDAAILTASVALGRRFGAHLDVLHLRPDLLAGLPVLGEGVTGPMVQQLMAIVEQAAEERTAAARAAYDRICAGAALSVAWRAETGPEAERVAVAGRLADLVVLARPPGPSEAIDQPALTAALFETGRPVLVIPPGGGALPLRHVAVAWNGSPQAARALAAALPLLAEAERVSILAGGALVPGLAPTAVIAYLSRQGIAAADCSFRASGGEIGTALLAEAARLGADLLVMGAYGRSRLRELILGGATREVLSAAALPVLMAH